MERISVETKQPTEAKHELLSVSEVSQEWEVHPNSVYGWVRSKQLPAVKVGPRMIRIRRSDLEEFITPYEAEASVWARPVK